MNTETLNRLLSAVNEFDASDLHLVAGVPPAFRVNGEIIIADEDALTEAEITEMAEGLMNDQQRKKFDRNGNCAFPSSTAPLAGCVPLFTGAITIRN